MNKVKISVKLAVIIASAVIAAAALAVTAVIMMNRADKKSREYSGEETNQALRLCFDVDILGDFEVVETKEGADGLYSEYIIAEKAVEIRIKRDFTRPKMSCRKQAKELYPKLSVYSGQNAVNNEIVSESGSFIVKSDGKAYKHTILLLRRAGWDYLVDFAAEKDRYGEFEEYINSLADSLFYL